MCYALYLYRISVTYILILYDICTPLKVINLAEIVTENSASENHIALVLSTRVIQ